MPHRPQILQCAFPINKDVPPCNHSATVKTRKLTLTQNNFTPPCQRSHPSSSNCPNTDFVAKGSASESHIAFSYPVPSVFFTLKQILSLFFFFLSFKSLTLLKIEGQLFCKMSISLDWHVLMIRFRIHIFLRTTPKLMLCSHCILLNNKCFQFVRLPAMKILIVWLRCICLATLPISPYN